MKRKLTISGVIFDCFNTLFMFAIFVIMVYPFLYVFNSSISSPGTSRGSLLLIPSGITFDSYKILFKDATILRAALLSIARSVIGPFGMLLVSGMAGYSLSKRNLIFGRFFRLFIFFTMYFSAGIIPVYLLIQGLGLTGSFWVYILPMLVSPFNLVLIKTYIEGIPESLSEAVLIDGGTEIDVYFRCIIHVCLPVNAAVLLFSAINHWNSFIDTQLYNYANPELYTLQYVLYNTLATKLTQSLEQAKTAAKNTTNTQSIKMAISVITILPIMCVYPILQRYFVSGLMIGSIKA